MALDPDASSMIPVTSHPGVGEHLFLSEDLSDVTILIESGEQQWRFPAHTLILSVQSPVFRRMLESDFSERKTGQIKIKDIKPRIVKLLLRYIYIGKVNLEIWQDGVALLQAANKYQIDPLVQYCGHFLENNVNIYNVCAIYNEAYLYTLPTLRDKCLKIILDVGFIILRSKSFEQLSKKCVMEIVASHHLNVDSELTVFEALLRWAPMQCCQIGVEVTDENILNELKPFLSYVCSDDMSDADKSALPPAILSCLSPNNRSRIAYCLPEILNSHLLSWNFDMDVELLACVRDSFTSLVFSLDCPLLLIGVKFKIFASDFPQIFKFFLTREHEGTYNTIHSANLTSMPSPQGVQLQERFLHDAQLVLRSPQRLEPSGVYKIYLSDRLQIIHCPKSTMVNNVLVTENGHVHLSKHGKSIWGISELTFAMTR